MRKGHQVSWRWVSTGRKVIEHALNIENRHCSPQQPQRKNPTSQKLLQEVHKAYISITLSINDILWIMIYLLALSIWIIFLFRFLMENGKSRDLHRKKRKRRQKKRQLQLEGKGRNEKRNNKSKSIRNKWKKKQQIWKKNRGYVVSDKVLIRKGNMWMITRLL